MRTLPKSRFDELLRILAGAGYEVIGPRIDSAAIVYSPIHSAKDFPIGWTDHQEPGKYRLVKREDDAYFGFAVGPHSWKKYLFPPHQKLWSARRTEDGFDVVLDNEPPPKRAFLGVRSCELHAIAVQDRVFINRERPFADSHYAAARERVFLIAVECTAPAATCFCTSTGTGPSVRLEELPPNNGPAEKPSRYSLPMNETPAQASPACDLILTELHESFVIRATSSEGERILNLMELSRAASEEVAESERRVEAAAATMGRKPDLSGVKELLQRNLDHPRWEHVAQRCLACTNCTMVCPTCFCSGVEDRTDLTLETAERVRSWDSCFNPEFASVHGGNYRPSIRGRYRQWLTHKFASWVDQFDTSGCVGCGRCIAWCPVGIDVTEEIAAIRASDGLRAGAIV